MHRLSQWMIIAVTALTMQGETKPQPWSKEPDGFKGVKFGSTVAQARAGLVFSECFRPNEQKTTCHMTVNAGGFDMSVFFLFVDDKFTCAVGSFPPESYSDIREMFIEKYGIPHVSQKDIVQNRMGAKFDREQLSWVGKISSVSLSKYGDKITEGVFSVSMANAPDPTKQKREEEKKKALN